MMNLKKNKKIYYHQHIGERLWKKAIQSANVMDEIKRGDAWIEGSLSAFEKMGYEVVADFRTNFIFYQKIFYSNSVLSLLRRVYKKIFRIIDNYFFNRVLRKNIAKHKPDIFYTELNPVVSQETLDFLRSKGIKSAEWFGIPPFTCKKNSNLIKTMASYDFIVSSTNIIPLCSSPHIPRCFIEVPPAYNPKIFKKMNLMGDDQLKYSHDVSFVGGVAKIHSRRWDVLEALSKNCDNFAFYGYGLNKVPSYYTFFKSHRGAPLAESFAKIINGSKISINLLLDYYEKLSSGINYRAFEIPACGGFQLCQYTPNLEEFFTPGENIETFKNIEELLEKVDYYLKNDNARMRIAENGYKRVLPFTYDFQVKKILSKIETGTPC